jgi:DNA-binding NtrC family response regulator
VLFDLAVDVELDLSGALVQLREALGARAVCFCEAVGGEPLIVASAGDLKDLPLAALAGFLGHGPSAPAFGEISGVMLPSAAGRRFALVSWGAPVIATGTERLLSVVLRFARHLHLGSEPAADRAPHGPSPLVFPRGYLPGHSQPMASLYAQMRAVVTADMPVLFVGETGVGKEHLAQMVHASSPRQAGPFVAVNCAAIPADMLEAEMFGIGRGVATGVSERPGKFQMARGGTLFLDEIAEMPLALQAKLLRALQGGEIQPVGGVAMRVDTRVVTATNGDLDQKIEQGAFRRDLYYRVAGLVLRVPSLRERREDIPELAQAFLTTFAHETSKSIPGFTAPTLQALTAYSWPGNVRELQHEVRRLAYLCPDGQPADHNLLSEHVLAGEDEGEDSPTPSLALEANVDHLERRLIRAALARTGARRSAAARLLGVSRNGLAMKMDRLGITG